MCLTDPELPALLWTGRTNGDSKVIARKGLPIPILKDVAKLHRHIFMTEYFPRQIRITFGEAFFPYLLPVSLKTVRGVDLIPHKRF